MISAWPMRHLSAAGPLDRPFGISQLRSRVHPEMRLVSKVSLKCKNPFGACRSSSSRKGLARFSTMPPFTCTPKICLHRNLLVNTTFSREWLDARLFQLFSRYCCPPPVGGVRFAQPSHTFTFLSPWRAGRRPVRIQNQIFNPNSRASLLDFSQKLCVRVLPGFGVAHDKLLMYSTSSRSYSQFTINVTSEVNPF